MVALSKINRIGNLAVFADYRWDTQLAPFKRYNLIFGWNGSGKTALSRMFASLPSGTHPLFPDLEYQVTIDGNQFTNKEPVAAKIRVFNRDYVDKNVKVVEGHANPIYVLGEESQEVLTQIKRDEQALNGKPGEPDSPGLVELRRRAVEERERTEKAVDRLFTQIAGTISAEWGRAGATRTYRRPNAKATFHKLTAEKQLSPEALEVCRLTLSESPEPQLTPLPLPVIERYPEFRSALRDIAERARLLLSAQIQNVAIARLTEQADISRWVEQGLALHAKHRSTKCEFCEHALPSERLNALANHFSEADKKLKADIDRLVANVSLAEKAVDAIKPYDDVRLYKQFRMEYSETVKGFEKARIKLKDGLAETLQQLSKKRDLTTTALSYATTLEEDYFEAAIYDVNQVLRKHNETAAHLESEQEAARSKLERHHLSTIFAEVREHRQKISRLEDEISKLDNGDPDIKGDVGIVGMRERIIANRAKVSSAHKSCKQLNETLRSFFGRDELAFEVENDSSGKTVGYKLKRHGEVAKNVSEGETAAIGFAHFVVQMSEQDFSIKDGIVVIDDPISSLDSGVLFKICAAIEKTMIRAGQLFILTHNMDFFNHMKRWFLHDTTIAGAGDETKRNYRLLMIQNRYDTATGKRIGLITDLDAMLRDYESEYHYLFKKLASFDQDNPETEVLAMRAIYDYPNLARKLLECFLAYRTPVRGNFYRRMHDLREVNPDILTEDIKYVYDFVNSHSHLDTKSGLLQFDATLAPNGREAIRRTLSLIEAADKHHYKMMLKAVKKT